MKTIEIIGLTEQPSSIECAVKVLGDPRCSDPMVSANISELERLQAVSPNGEWLVLVRKAQHRFPHAEIYIICRAEEDAEEFVVPLSLDWRHPRPRDIWNDGTFLFQAGLERSHRDDGHSRRPLVFKPGDKEPLALPPEYKERELGTNPMKDDRPTLHTPYCYAPNGTVFGWMFDRDRNLTSHDTSHVVWCKDKAGKWQVEQMPDFMNSKWVWPAHNGLFVFCDRPDKEDQTIRFGIFDGTETEIYEGVTIEGHRPMVESVAADGTFSGNYSFRDGKRGQDKEGRPEISTYAFLVRPELKEVYIFNDFQDKNPWLHELSANGQYVIGSHPGFGYFLMKRHDAGYRYATLTTKDWRIDDITAVTDDGKVFATATCTQRRHGCFRLKLPVLLAPQW